MVNGNNMALAGCGADLLANTVHGSDVHYLNGLPASFPASHDFAALANARRPPVVSNASAPRGAFHGAESMSLDGLSSGIMSSAKTNKSLSYSYNISPEKSINTHPESCEWPRDAAHPLSSSSSSSTPVVLSTVTGSSSSPAMEYMTNKYLLVQQQPQQQQQHHPQHHHHNHQHQQHQQQQHQQHQDLHQHQSTTPLAGPNGSYSHPYMPFPANGYQGAYAQYAPFNIEVTSPANGAHQAAIPMSSTPTGVAWTNDTVGSASMMHMQTAAPAVPLRDIKIEDSASHRPVQGQMPRPKQAKSYPLHITTSLEPNMASMYPQHPQNVTSPPMNATGHGIQSSMVQSYQWGVGASPVDTSFNSESSPFSSSSPSLSNTNFDNTRTSCDSSRPTSPLFGHGGHFEGHGSERRVRAQESEVGSSSTGHHVLSRKSSMSSTTSSGSSPRRMSMAVASSPSSSMCPPSPQTPTVNNMNGASHSSSQQTHQCPKCGQYFAGPAVLLRHIESIHDKLLWNCVGCKSNLSRRDAVTRHINLSPMDSICRQVGAIGQIKMINGTEFHQEISSYRAKPLDEVMNRMGKKIPANLRKEMDQAKVHEDIESTPTTLPQDGGFENGLEDYPITPMELEIKNEEYNDGDGQQKRRRRPSQSIVRRKK
ncbi:hypothetical protein BGX34_001041 [Mortierella sp. NVP85]|nr:hypothetical protein BGX34_001041 [Mortierella sp. NVP85]